jgi:hypothetical protein
MNIPVTVVSPELLKRFSEAVSLLQGISFLKFAANHSWPTIGQYVKSAAEEDGPVYSML